MRKSIDVDFVVVCGQHFDRSGKKIYGPAKTIARLAQGGYSTRSRLLVDIDCDGNMRITAEFKTLKEARVAFEKIKAKKGAMTLREYTARHNCEV